MRHGEMEGYRRLLGDPLQQVQRLLGHASLTTTYIYLDHIAARADTVDAAVEELLTLVPKCGRYDSVHARGVSVAFSRRRRRRADRGSRSVTGLRFTSPRRTAATHSSTSPRCGRAALRWLPPVRLATSARPAVRCGARSTVKAYAVTIPRFFAYLADAGEPHRGLEDASGAACRWLRGVARGRRPLADPSVHGAGEGCRILRQIAVEPDVGSRPICGNGCAISAPSPSNGLVRATLIAPSSRASFATPPALMSNGSSADSCSRVPSKPMPRSQRVRPSAVEAVIGEHGRLGARASSVQVALLHPDAARVADLHR